MSSTRLLDSRFRGNDRFRQRYHVFVHAGRAELVPVVVEIVMIAVGGQSLLLRSRVLQFTHLRL